LRNFRNYDDCFLEFSKGVNLFLGQNAQGKTNLLEAIYFLIFGSSFRTKKLQELIKVGCKEFYIECIFEKFGIDQSIKISYGSNRKIFFYNSSKLDSFRHLLGLLHAVFMTPKDKDLIEGSPEFRREYIDLTLLQEDPLYYYHLNRYFKAMKQRNCMLKSKQILGVECFENEMAKSASYITLKRGNALSDIKLRINDYCRTLSNDSFDLLFLSLPHDLYDFYIGALRKNRCKEIVLGYTLNGPHRDDFDLLIQNFPAKYFASEGQKSTLANILRFASWSRLKEEAGQIPILCMDDMGISLDPFRKKDLMSNFTSFGQIFITSADIDYPFSFNSDAKIFNVTNGRCANII
jgi:DNA replication and repair protein RecF